MKCIIVIFTLLFAGTVFAAMGDVPLKLGVLANRPKPMATGQWQPLADYLQSALKQPVELAVYDHAELSAAAAKRSVDVVLTSAGHYILLNKTAGLSAPLATLVSREGNVQLNAFGGAIFTRAGRSDITSLKDLSGKRIAAISLEAFGAYQAEAFEMVEAGVPLPTGDRLLLTGLPQDRVIEAVLAGRADAGFVRAGLIETLAGEGKLALGQVKLINRQSIPDYPFAVSTRLYPEWPVAVMPQVDKQLAARLAAALFLLPHDSFNGTAAVIHGFDIPANYNGVENLLRRLRLPPFDHPPEISLSDLWRRYGSWITSLSLLLLLLAGTSGGLVIIYRRSQRSLHELKRVEIALNRLNEELDQRVSERTSLLRQKSEELEQANERLKEVDRLKSLFIASMSHELRTPLNSVIGFSTVLLDEWVGPINAEQKLNLASIQSSGRLLLAMINDVLDVTQIESGTIRPLIEEFDLYDLLSEAEKQIAATISGKGLELRSELIHLRLRTDRRRLLQCIMNLLGNAARFSDRGNVTLEAELIPASGETPKSEFVEIRVSDTGIGIGEGDLRTIFTPFHRIVTPGRTIIPGTGIGLYLARKIVTEILNGEIKVSSEPGKGSRFTLRIPVAQA